MMTALITSWRQKVWGGYNGNMVMLPWLPFHNRFFLNCLIFEGVLQKIDLNVVFLILVSLYFAKGKRYEHSLIIYLTALV